MARILNIDVPNNKRIIISLTYIFGIGKSLAKKILTGAKVDENIKTSELTDDQLKAIRQEAEKYQTEGELRRKEAFDIKRLMEIKAYRGIRHRKGLPVRGQTTKVNARTRKGAKKTVANKKK